MKKDFFQQKGKTPLLKDSLNKINISIQSTSFKKSGGIPLALSISSYCQSKIMQTVRVRAVRPSKCQAGQVFDLPRSIK